MISPILGGVSAECNGKLNQGGTHKVENDLKSRLNRTIYIGSKTGPTRETRKCIIINASSKNALEGGFC